MLGARLIKGLWGFSTASSAQTLLVERPFDGEYFATQSIKTLYQANKNELMDLVHLMNSNVLIKYHSVVSHICNRLLSFQKALTKEEIVRALELCYRAQVKHPAIVRHLENELLHRFSQPVRELVVEHDQIQKQRTKELFAKLEKGSGDVFGLLNNPEDFEVKPEEVLGSEAEEPQPQQVVAMSPEKIVLVESMLKEFGNLGFLLTELQVQSTNLLSLFKSLFMTLGNQENLDIKSLIHFVRINNRICLITTQEFEKQQQYYMRRSLKNVKKYQASFYEKMLPILANNLPLVSPGDLETLLKEIADYEIKSNKPHVFLLQIFRQYSSLPNFQYNNGIMIALTKILKKKPKVFQKLKLINQQLLAQKSQRVVSQE